MTKDIEQINNSDGIVEIRYGNEIYKTWTVKLIKPFIFKFLKEKYIDSLIIYEINRIDIVIFDNITNEQIPVEIQKTPINSGTKTFLNSQFENVIRKQLEDNLENYGKCWFFFDSEYLRFLQYGDVGKTTSINMTWLVKYMKENTLRVFTIKYDGTVKELTTKDFDFLKDVSQTCAIGYDNDERILNRNKLKIFHNVTKGYNFTQEEIIQFEIEFNKRDNKKDRSIIHFKKNNNERCKLYGYVLGAVDNLSAINNILYCTTEKGKSKRTIYAVTLELFYQNNFMGNSDHAQIQFIDKFNISQYFPGYIKNKELWDYCKKKQRIFSIKEFNGIIEGTFNYEFIKKQSTILDY